MKNGEDGSPIELCKKLPPAKIINICRAGKPSMCFLNNIQARDWTFAGNQGMSRGKKELSFVLLHEKTSACVTSVTISVSVKYTLGKANVQESFFAR